MTCLISLFTHSEFFMSHFNGLVTHSEFFMSHSNGSNGLPVQSVYELLERLGYPLEY